MYKLISYFSFRASITSAGAPSFYRTQLPDKWLAVVENKSETISLIKTLHIFTDTSVNELCTLGKQEINLHDNARSVLMCGKMR
jgi:hypothetical protein